MSGLDIRRGELRDAAPCAAILNAWIDDTPWMPRMHPAESVDRHYREFVFTRREVWVAGDPPVGYIALAPEDSEITSFYAAVPGNGTGKALLDHVKGSFGALSLWTFIANEGARRFYAREGFREVERTEGDNEERLPDVKCAWEHGHA